MSQELFSDVMLASGELRKSGANQSFPLANPDQVCYVVKGYVDIFSVNLDNDQPKGSRFYFSTAGQGELLFGFKSNLSGEKRGLIAVPSTDAEIVTLNFGKIREICLHPELAGTLAALLEKWIGHVSYGISKDFSPRTDLVVEAGQKTVVKADLKIRARRGIVWLEFLKGNALFMGMKELMEPDERFTFPVSQDSWIQTIEDSDIRCYTTLEFLNNDAFWSHLQNFYEVIFYCEYFNARLNTVDEFNRLSEKVQQGKRTHSAAILKIASVLNDNQRNTYIDPTMDPLLIACQHVAGYAGITITVPPSPKNEEAPPLTLNDITRASRFRTRKVALTGSWWNQDNGPLLAFTKSGRAPVALIPKSPGKYEYINPAESIRRKVNAEIASGLSVEAYQFYRPFPDQPINGFDLVRFGLKSCSRDLLYVLFAGLAGGILSLLVPVLTGKIFDLVIPQSDKNQLYLYALVIFMSIVAISIFQVVRSFAMIRIETKLDFSLQSAVWDRLLNLHIPFFRKFQAGELAAKANSIMMLRKILSDTVIYSLLGSIFMLINLVLLFFYEGQLALIILGFLIVSMLFVFYTGSRIQKRQRIVINMETKLFGMLIQFLSSISKIRIAGAEVHAFAQWADKYSVSKRETYAVRKLFLTVTLMTTILPLIITLLVFAVIAGQVPDTLSTGEFLTFYTALIMAIGSFLQLGMASISYFMVLPMLDSIRPILQSLPENISLKPEIRQLSGEIEVTNLCFRYQPDMPMVLDNVSLHIQPGEFVAIVGASGSGKSTLLRMLLGFEAPESGAVYFDQQDISSFDPASIRRQAGTVLQNIQLANGNILTNITGVTEATFEDAWEAARNVGLDEDIKGMPMGMYTVITGGLSTISGGQRQRIMIARAIVNKPRILFLDEATSALDNKTQHIVSQSLEKLQATRIVIAHRLTTVQNADRIYLMEKGRIVEVGSYSELLEKGGKFTELVKRQMVE